MIFEQLRCADRQLDLRRPVIMGILNVTPDSFSDGGCFLSVEKAVLRAEQMVAEGAHIVDVGGESTRPGAQPVALADERARVIPVVEQLVKRLPVVVSVDTRKPELMRAAIDAGASMINDVTALQSPGALDVVAANNVAVCLMHMRGEPQTMQHDTRYDDVVADVVDFLDRRVQACLAAGIQRERILIDPGFGFGKTIEQNYALLRNLSRLQALGAPVVVGVSRKSMIGGIVNAAAPDRGLGSACLASLAVYLGANILRVHDVAETAQAIALARAVLGDWFNADESTKT